ncbi:unnamed protein product [Camellia sinensis]
MKAMDPPDPEVVENALSLLDHINALEKTSHRGRYEPAFYGRLLVSFSLPFDTSMIILKFRDMGMLREGILLVHRCNKDLSSSKSYHKRHEVCDVQSKTARVIVNSVAGTRSELVIPHVCQVHRCNKDLSSSKSYHKRHKVFDVQSKTARVIVNSVAVHRCNKDLSSSKSYHKRHKVCDVQSKTTRVIVNSVAAECVRGILKDKTILLVTHQVDFLHNIDLILVMRDGVIVQSGKYNDILQSGVDFQVLVSAHETSMELVEAGTTMPNVSELLGISSELLSLKYCSRPSPVVADADIKPEVHRLIHDLVLHIHKNEPDIEKIILVFLPKYYALEQQWFLLKPFSISFKVHILHSSIDIEHALKVVKIWKSHRNNYEGQNLINSVILATNIAESSVTIPKVAFVIDSCRSLQVLWDSNRKTESAELVWVSKSQANQRKGRTGRTCDGQIYRLVTGSFFNELKDFECPTILRLSLRQQVLLIRCAESKAINDLKVLLQKAMDPPDPEVVEDALSLLDHINALEKTSHRGRYEPTFYGRLLVSFSLPFDASMIILKFGDMGMLREGILLGVLMDAQPLPILRPFYAEYTDCYYSGDEKSTALTGRMEMDKLRLDRLKQLLHFDEMKAAQVLVPAEEWCSFHNLVQPSLNHVAEICMGLTISCVCNHDLSFVSRAGPADSMAADDEHSELPNETRMSTIIKEGCRNGDKCEFSHDVGPSTSSSSRSSLCLPEDETVYATSLLRLFPTSYDGCILLLDDTDFHFSSHLSRHYDPSKIISTTVLSAGSPLDASLSGQRTTQSHGVKSSVSYGFPNSIATVKTWKNRSLLQTFFKYLAIRILADELHEVQVILTMNNIRFLDYRYRF